MEIYFAGGLYYPQIIGTDRYGKKVSHVSTSGEKTFGLVHCDETKPLPYLTHKKDGLSLTRYHSNLYQLSNDGMSPQDIEQRLLDEGNGAHAIIGIDRAEGAGHWFNAACIDGKVVAIDGQDGSISGWSPDYGDVVNWEMSIRKETNNG